jgi:hypothetical protein
MAWLGNGLIAVCIGGDDPPRCSMAWPCFLHLASSGERASIQGSAVLSSSTQRTLPAGNGGGGVALVRCCHRPQDEMMLLNGVVFRAEQKEETSPNIAHPMTTARKNQKDLVRVRIRIGSQKNMKFGWAQRYRCLGRMR